MQVMGWDDISQWLAPRDRDANKGHFGHVLVVAGEIGMPGAARLAGEAALRSGAGLVTVATRPEHAVVVTGHRPELMCFPITDAERLSPLFAKASVVAVGPGLTQTPWSDAVIAEALAANLPTVVDAGALDRLPERDERRDNWILTPHPGEAARLLGCTVSDIQQDRPTAAARIQQRYGGVVVLKGRGTLIQSATALLYSPAGNPGMASGGMGDVLTGVIAGLLAQGLPLVKAATAGVVIHGTAGDRAAQLGERGLLASDLFPHFQSLLN